MIMKINRIARRIKKARITIVCLAIAIIPLIEYQVSETLAARIDQISARQAVSQQVFAPNVGIYDMFTNATR
jgi:hypothetical protein